MLAGDCSCIRVAYGGTPVKLDHLSPIAKHNRSIYAKQQWFRFGFFLLLIASGFGRAGVFPQSSLPKALAEAEMRWKSRGPASYRYTIESECLLCDPPVDVVVMGGKCISAKPQSPRPNISCAGRTIPEIFQSIHGWSEDTSGSMISETFDERFGYPIASFIQTNIQTDTSENRIRRFRVVK
jgi:hypothetical protein